jgi:hypothetical protein
MAVVLLQPGDPLRPEATALARRVFQRRHGAEIAHLPPRLLAVIGADGRPAAVVGLRDARDGFFSECYLDAPVERSIAQVSGGLTPARGAVLELTALASEQAPALFVLLRGAHHFAQARGFHWGLFTATTPIRLMARRIGVPLLDLAPARRARAPEPERWGAYYDQDPHVCAVAVAVAGAQALPLRRAADAA